MTADLKIMLADLKDFAIWQLQFLILSVAVCLGDHRKTVWPTLFFGYSSNPWCKYIFSRGVKKHSINSQCLKIIKGKHTEVPFKLPFDTTHPVITCCSTVFAAVHISCIEQSSDQLVKLATLKYHILTKV